MERAQRLELGRPRLRIVRKPATEYLLLLRPVTNADVDAPPGRIQNQPGEVRDDLVAQRRRLGGHDEAGLPRPREESNFRQDAVAGQRKARLHARLLSSRLEQVLTAGFVREEAHDHRHCDASAVQRGRPLAAHRVFQRLPAGGLHGAVERPLPVTGDLDALDGSSFVPPGPSPPATRRNAEARGRRVQREVERRPEPHGRR